MTTRAKEIIRLTRELLEVTECRNTLRSDRIASGGGNTDRHIQIADFTRDVL